MPKKRSSATGSLALAKSSAKQKRPDHEIEGVSHETEGASNGKSIGSKAKSGNEIEEIFSTMKKRKTQDQDQSDEPEALSTVQIKPKEKKNKVKDLSSKGMESVVAPSRPRRRTQDGLAIYSAQELGVGRSDAGGTPLCPFDCDCCF